MSKPVISELGGGLTTRKGVTASHTLGSGVRSALDSREATSLSSDVGGDYTTQEAARVANNFASRLTKSHGGGTRSTETTGGAKTRTSIKGTALESSSTALDAGQVTSKVGGGANFGGSASLTNGQGQEQSITKKSPTGKPGTAVANNVNDMALDEAKRYSQSQNGSTGLNGRVNVEAATGLVVTSADQKADSAKKGASAGDQLAAKRAFDIADTAMADVVGQSATSGEKAAARAIMGSIAERINSQYGTSLASSFSTHASSSNERSQSAAVESTNPYAAEARSQETLAKLGGGNNPTQAVKALKEDPQLLDGAASDSSQKTVDAVAPLGGVAKGLDGAIDSPQSVDGHRQGAVSAVGSQRDANDAESREVAEGYLAQARSHQHASPDAKPNQSLATEAYETTADRVAQGEQAIKNTATFDKGVNQLAAEIHAGDRGVGSAAGRAYLGSAMQALGMEHYSGEQVDRLTALAASDPAVAAVINSVGESGRVRPGDIETVGRSATGHAFSEKMNEVGGNVESYVSKFITK